MRALGLVVLALYLPFLLITPLFYGVEGIDLGSGALLMLYSPTFVVSLIGAGLLGLEEPGFYVLGILLVFLALLGWSALMARRIAGGRSPRRLFWVLFVVHLVQAFMTATIVLGALDPPP